MKNIFFKFLFLLLFIASGKILAQPYQPAVDGKVEDENGPAPGVVIQVYQGTKLISTTTTGADGRYIIQLPLNGDFTVNINKSDFVTKKYLVSTRGITPERANEKFNPVIAETGIRKKVEGVDYSLYNQPMTKFFFDGTKDKFEFDKAYLDQMLGAQDAVFAAEKAMADKLKNQEKNYQAALKNGEKALAKKDYDGAIAAYTEASSIKPKDQLAKDKIAEAQKLKTDIAKAKADADAKAKADADAKAKADKAKYSIPPTLGGNDAAYKTAITKGDNNAKQKKYFEAQVAYQEALSLKPNDAVAKAKLAELETYLKGDNSVVKIPEIKEKQAHPLCAKYPQGITEETKSEKGVVIIRRILVKDKDAWVYTKKIFNWGGTACFRDETPITESTFEQETK